MYGLLGNLFALALRAGNKDEAAVCGCNPAVSVLVMVLFRKVYFSRSMISLACSLLLFHFTADHSVDPTNSSIIVCGPLQF